MPRARWTLLSLLVVVGCADGAPPLDELPLRDALRADPSVVAALGAPARQRLAARFDAAAAEYVTADTLADVTTPAEEIAALDDVRARRAADALVIGAIGGGVARAAATAGKGDDQGDEAPLPALEGEVATTTAAVEARAMSGAAEAPLRAILEASGARRLERVVGWPIGAVALGETVYVNAAWLVALAPGGDVGDGGGPDAEIGRAAGDPTAAGAPAPPTARAPAEPVESFDGGGPPDDIAYATFDAGTGVLPPLPPPPPPPPPPGPSFWDACAASSDGCAASSDSCDTSDGSDDSCSGTDDGSDDACSTPPDDGNCRMAPGREHPGAATIVWVLAPLGFLIGRRR